MQHANTESTLFRTFSSSPFEELVVLQPTLTDASKAAACLAHATPVKE